MPWTESLGGAGTYWANSAGLLTKYDQIPFQLQQHQLCQTLRLLVCVSIFFPRSPENKKDRPAEQNQKQLRWSSKVQSQNASKCCQGKDIENLSQFTIWLVRWDWDIIFPLKIKIWDHRDRAAGMTSLLTSRTQVLEGDLVPSFFFFCHLRQ